MTQLQQCLSATSTLDEEISGNFGKRRFLAEDALCRCSDLHGRQSLGSGALSARAELPGLQCASESQPAAGPHQGKLLHLRQSPGFPPHSCHNLLGTDARRKLSSVTSSAALSSGSWMGEESSPPTHSLTYPKGHFLLLKASPVFQRSRNCNLGPEKNERRQRATGKEEE